MSAAYYNENDPYAAQWLRNLITGGLIAPGEVDDRDIRDVRPNDVRGFTQCHFFAGIGGWSFALRIAGWPDDKPAWTGSCPCQPFSQAGKRAGDKDSRHLWPEFFRLVSECRPFVVFGEQVSSRDGIVWLDAVSDDMEAKSYATGKVVLPACGVGAPHKRDRIYFVAHALGERRQGDGVHVLEGGSLETTLEIAWRGQARALANADGIALQQRGEEHGRRNQRGDEIERARPGSGIGAGPANGFWRDAEWLPCLDGKARAIEPGTFPLAHGVSGRVGKLRAYGNAIVPQVGARVIRAYLDLEKQKEPTP